jgi:hypothetical protein
MATTDRTADDGTVQVLVQPGEAPFIAEMVGDDIRRVREVGDEVVQVAAAGDDAVALDEARVVLERRRDRLNLVGWGDITEPVAFPMEAAR